MVAETKQIEKQVADLQARRESLASDVSEAGRALDDAREGLISGKAKAPQVTTAQSTHTALAEALAALDARIAGKREQLQSEREEEERRALAERRAELTHADAADAELFKQLFEEGSAFLREFDRRSAEIVTRYRSRAAEVRSRGGTQAEMRPPGVLFGDLLAEVMQRRAAEERRLRIKANLGRAAPGVRVPLARVGESAIQTRSADEAASD